MEALADAAASISALPSIPPKPDRSAVDLVKTKYKRLQGKLGDIEKDREILQKELQSAEAKLQRLQTEGELILDQLLDMAANTDEPLPDIFSDEEPEDGDLRNRGWDAAEMFKKPGQEDVWRDPGSQTPDRDHPETDGRLKRQRDDSPPPSQTKRPRLGSQGTEAV